MSNKFFYNIKRSLNRAFGNRNTENTITVLDAKQMLRLNSNIILLDVRSVLEHNEKNIPGSVLIPLYELRQKARNLLKDKEQVIIVYCKNGGRSERAVQTLKELGYTRAYSVEGGIEEW